MKKRMANATCVICDYSQPRSDMKKRSFSYTVGSSIGSSYNPRTGKSGAVSSRVYTRTAKHWVCKSCWRARPHYLVTLLLVLFLGPLFVPRYSGDGPIFSFFYLITLGWFGLGWLGAVVLAFFGSLPNADGLRNSKIL